MKNKHAKFGGPSYNNLRDICVTDGRKEGQKTDRRKNNAENIRPSRGLERDQLVIMKLNIKTFSNPE